jgi:hypothetical protein
MLGLNFVRFAASALIVIATHSANAAPATHFIVSPCFPFLAPCAYLIHAVGQPFSFGVFAVDGNNQLATNYTGTVSITSSDFTASLPPPHTFAISDNSSFRFTLTINSLPVGGSNPAQVSVVATDGIGLTGSTPFPVAFAQPTTAIFEYFWPNGDNYFITADPNEIASLDAASAASGGGPGTWNRTGITFNAGGPTQVCRFFGNTNVNPATQSTYGPNSHFYTMFPNECANLQAAYNPNAMSWNLESPAGPYPPPFFMTQPTTLGVNGTCPVATVPVYRAYDNSNCVAVSSTCKPQPNHRITTDLNAINQVVARGWTNEGVVMCAPL